MPELLNRYSVPMNSGLKSFRKIRVMLLADSSRPLNLNDFVGQKHLVGPDGPIRKMLTAKQIFPMIFGVRRERGKTTLARIIAKSVGAGYHELSAVSAGKADIKKIIDTLIP